MSRSGCGIYSGGRVLSFGRAQGQIRGAGVGSVLLNVGGPGVGSSYSSVEEFKEITGRGGSLGAGLSDKLQKLMVKPLERKPHNIRF
jgi:hypothetical protein